MYKTYVDLHGLSTVSRGFREAVSGHPRYGNLRRTVDRVNRLFSETDDMKPLLIEPESCNSVLQLLSFLSPAHRNRLVAAAVGLESDEDKADVLSRLSDRAAYFERGSIETMLNAAIALRERMEQPRRMPPRQPPQWMMDTARDLGFISLAVLGFTAELALENALNRAFGPSPNGRRINSKEFDNLVFGTLLYSSARILLRLSDIRVPRLGRPDLARLFAPTSVNSHFVYHPGKEMLAMMGKALREMDTRQRNRVIAAILRSRDESERAAALASLGPVMALLTQAQRRRVIAAATIMGTQGERASALAGLSAGISDLAQPQRDLLVSAIVALATRNEENYEDDGMPTKIALACLGSMMQYLTEEQKEMILDVANSPYNDIAVAAFKGFSVAMGGLTILQRGRLLQSGLDGIAPEHKADRVIALVAGMPHLDDLQFNRLLESLIQITDPTRKSEAIAAAATVIPHLANDRRNRLASAALDIQDEGAKTLALAALAKQIAHLHEPECTLVIEAANALGNPSLRCQALGALAAEVPERVFEYVRSLPTTVRYSAVASLATRMDSLIESQRADLVADAVAMGGPRARDLAALGPGVAHLSRPQKDALLEAAIGIPDGEVMLEALAGLHALADDLTDEQFAHIERTLANLRDDEDFLGLTLPQLSAIMPQLRQERCDRLLQAVSTSPDRDHATRARCFLEAARATTVAREWQP
ncbi:MAG TPA: hypothetical protein VFP68_17050 [Burkholderiaceae bacterium]|nr:hypothetical protein [Burkholderiaceae bacterium]